jgi:uncharacterized membrane protein
MNHPLIAAIVGLLVVVSGVYITIHEVRRRERKTTRKEFEELTVEVTALRHLLLEQRRYIYKVAMMMIDHGIDVPEPPAPNFDDGEYD